jgi:nitrogen fixation NifU-like protein
MYSAEILDHFERPRNAGELPAPAITVEVTNPVCGDMLRLSLLVEEGRIRQAAFKAKGCVPAIAAGSALTELVTGKAMGEAAQVSTETVAACLGGLPPEGGHAAELATEALRMALRKARA